MARTPISHMSGSAGFTLIELLVVLTVVGLLAALAAPRISQDLAARSRNVEAARLKVTLAKARAEALAGHGAATVNLAPRFRFDALRNETGQAITFFADGSATGGTVLLDDAPLLAVDWLSGRLRDAR